MSAIEIVDYKPYNGSKLCKGLVTIKFHGLMMCLRVRQYKQSHVYVEMPAIFANKKMVHVCWWPDHISSEHFQKLVTVMLAQKYPEALEVSMKISKKQYNKIEKKVTSKRIDNSGYKFRTKTKAKKSLA